MRSPAERMRAATAKIGMPAGSSSSSSSKAVVLRAPLARAADGAELIAWVGWRPPAGRASGLVAGAALSCTVCFPIAGAPAGGAGVRGIVVPPAGAAGGFGAPGGFGATGAPPAGAGGFGAEGAWSGAAAGAGGRGAAGVTAGASPSPGLERSVIRTVSFFSGTEDVFAVARGIEEVLAVGGFGAAGVGGLGTGGFGGSAIIGKR